MSPAETLTRRILDALVARGLLTAEQSVSVEDAARVRRSTAGAVLLERGLVSVSDVTLALEDELGVPRVNLANYAPEERALALVPPRVAREGGILPLFEIEGILTVAIGDAMDAFGLDDVAAAVGLEVEPVLVDRDALARAIREHYGTAGTLGTGGLETAPKKDAATILGATGEAQRAVTEVRTEEPAPEPATGEASDAVGEHAATEDAREVVEAAGAGSHADHAPEPMAATEEVESHAVSAAAAGSPIDLDMLAVADARSVALLVSAILEDAVARGASRVHLLPYKDEFFLVYRIDGALERVAEAPLAFEAALVEGFKHYARLGETGSGRPVLGRVRRRIGEKEVVLTVSVVPTVAGQRLVASLEASEPMPRELATLGASEAEARALRAMVERGRGILLICAPLAGGASTTYYALLAHAAGAGRTVYSVERSIGYEIPAVAQVMVQPGGPPPAAYVTAGMRQDTDVIAIDGVRSVEDVHVALEAAGHGKLVVATFPAAGIAAGVRRMLDLGAEPHSLAAALTLGVGQRLVRLNCPSCKQETAGDLARRIPGAPDDIVDVAGTGCPNCGKTGFRDVTGLFEVLPFTEPVRAAVARGAAEEDIQAAAIAAGMRPLIVAGLARVRSGDVSAEELNRVLRFAD